MRRMRAARSIPNIKLLKKHEHVYSSLFMFIRNNHTTTYATFPKTSTLQKPQLCHLRGNGKDGKKERKKEHSLLFPPQPPFASLATKSRFCMISSLGFRGKKRGSLHCCKWKNGLRDDPIRCFFPRLNPAVPETLALPRPSSHPRLKVL